MSGIVVPSAPAPAPGLEVDPAGVAQAGTDLLAASSQLDDLAGLASGAGRLPAWTGVAAEDYRADLRVAGDQVDAMSLALRSVARRVDVHARAMERLLRERDELEDRRRLVEHDLRELATAVAAHDALAGVPPVDPATALVRAEQARELGDRSAGAGARVAGLDADLRAWSSRVAAEERGVVEALDRVLTLPQVDRRFGGVVDPANGALDRLPATRDPRSVRGWWGSLTPGERLGVIAAAPGLVGALDGLPARVRDRANRDALARDLAAWRRRRDAGTITPAERRALANAEATQDALAAHDGQPGHDGVPVPSTLWLYDPDALAHGDRLDGLVAIAHGDPDTADTIAVNVSGIGTEMADVGEKSRRAWDLLDAAQAADPDHSYASMAWLGYDAPSELPAIDALRERLAQAGGERLADALDGLTASRDGQVSLVPIGHSYGSATLGAALAAHDLHLRRAAVVGSPGLTSDVHHVDDLGVDGDSFYVGRNHDDAVAGLGTNGRLGLDSLRGAGLGHDPADDRFGATRFPAEADPGDDDHSSYYEPGSESLANLGRIVAGLEPDRAEPVHDPWWGPPQDPEDPNRLTPW